MKTVLRAVLPQTVTEWINRRRAVSQWRARSFRGNSPQIVKEKILAEYGFLGGVWIETGTYLGTTTSFLSKRYPHVYTIEPSLELYQKAQKRFRRNNVTVFNDVSENVLPSLLPSLDGQVNFWLDGHYSGGVTFKGHKECPVEDELMAIELCLANFTKLAILIDDVRCFYSSSSNSEYPSVDYLVDWARRMGLVWRIEHDIFIMRSV